MPIRSNRFQRIVTYIAEQLATLGAKVRESVELPEKMVGSLCREVDTLIELTAESVCIRIAVESRQRTRKSDVQWVDELIGKYIGLPVDKVVAVSSVGFSAAAKLKAEAYGIELLSPRAITEVDWPARFQRLGVLLRATRFKIVQIEFCTTPPFAGQVSLDDRIRVDEKSRNAIDRTVREFVEEHRPVALKGVQKHINENLLSICKTLADLEKPLAIEWPGSVSGLSLLAGGSCYRIDKIKFHIIAYAENAIAQVDHRLLGENSLLSSCLVGDRDLVIAQTADALQARIFPQSAIDRNLRKRQANSKTAKR